MFCSAEAVGAAGGSPVRPLLTDVLYSSNAVVTADLLLLVVCRGHVVVSGVICRRHVDGTDLRVGDGAEGRGGGAEWCSTCAGAAVRVFLDVQRQVVGAREAALTQFALEGLGAGVLAVVSSQLV